MKRNWIILVASALLISFAAGFLVAGRYEYRTGPAQLPVRFDRWTGKAEIIQITLNFDPATAKPAPDR